MKMSGFEKFKKHLLLTSVLKSVILSFFVAMLFVSLLFFLDKLDLVSAHVPVYVVCGISSSLVSFFVSFLLTYPTDRRVAKKLDTELDLNEKIQTMLAFYESDEPMHVLQRRDADAALLNSSTKKLRHPRWAIYLAVPLIAVSMLSVAIVTPAKEIEQPTFEEENDDPDYEFDSWQRTALLALIENVKKSEMQDEPKASTVEELESLLSKLEKAEKESEMKKYVISAITNIRTITNEHNSYLAFAQALASSPALEGLGNSIRSMSLSSMKNEAELIYATFLSVASDKEAFKERLSEVTTALSLSISKVPLSEAPDSDLLRIELLNLLNGLNDIFEYLESYTVLSALTKIETLLNNSAIWISDALLFQAGNKIVCDATVKELMRIFKIDESAVPPNETGDGAETDSETSGDSDSDDEEKENDGGYSDPDRMYPSNDQVWWPDEYKNSEYGPLLRDEDDYLQDADNSMSMVDDSLASLINEYFNKLSNGFLKEDEEG